MSKLRLERVFPADAKTVFAFVTRPENLAKWWGPEGVSLPSYKLDFTKPGAWSSEMLNADGKRFKVTGKVVAVDAPKSVELTWAWHDEDGVRGHESRVRFEITPQGAKGAKFTLVHSGLRDEESQRTHNMGWTSSLKKLERLAAQPG